MDKRSWKFWQALEQETVDLEILFSANKIVHC